jgi:hypothetical protein
VEKLLRRVSRTEVVAPSGQNRVYVLYIGIQNMISPASRLSADLLKGYGAKAFSLRVAKCPSAGQTTPKIPPTSELERDKARDQHFPGESTWRTESRAAENGIHPRTTS